MEDAWGTGAAVQHKMVDMGFVRFKAELHRWHDEERKRIGEASVYAVHKFTLRMLGTQTQRALATKAAETGTFAYLVLLQTCGAAARTLGRDRCGFA